MAIGAILGQRSGIQTISGQQPDPNGNIDALLTSGGTMQGNVNMNNNKITGLPTPSQNSDAVPFGFIKLANSIVSTPEMHRNIFRGKNLGTSVTQEQLAKIRDGSFDDLFVADYWVINGVTWRIADIDYWLRCGDQELTKHHLVIVPDTALYLAKMNSTNTAVGGYVGSEMYRSNLQQAKTTVTSAFGSAVLSHREYLTNAVTTGYPSAGSWYDSTVELMNECMVYGAHVFTPAGDGSMIPERCTISKTQLALFRLAPKFITIQYWYWLRDVVSSSIFANVATYGYANYYNASFPGGVRVVFGIC